MNGELIELNHLGDLAESEQHGEDAQQNAGFFWKSLLYFGFLREGDYIKTAEQNHHCTLENPEPLRLGPTSEGSDATDDEKPASSRAQNSGVAKSSYGSGR